MSRNLQNTSELTSVSFCRPADNVAIARIDSGDAYTSDYKTGAFGKLLYVNTAASTAHTATTDAAVFDTSYSLPANSVRAGTVLKIRYQGIATATNSTDTLTIRLLIGSTALLVGTATDVANNNIFAGEFTLVVRTIGSSGTAVGYGTHTDVPAASGTASHAVTEILASTTLDTTAAQVIGVEADWSSNNAGNSCRLDILEVIAY